MSPNRKGLLAKDKKAQLLKAPCIKTYCKRYIIKLLTPNLSNSSHKIKQIATYHL